MDDRPTHNAPRLLMLSHCLPDPLGDLAQTRAWQLLNLACRSHRVSLLCRIKHHSNLTHWRAVRAQTDHLAMETGALRYQLLTGVIALFSTAAAETLRLRAPMAHPDKAGLPTAAYDTVLCTHPELWTHARDVSTAVRICDAAGYATNRPDQMHWDVILTDGSNPLRLSKNTEGRRVATPRALDVEHLAASMWTQNTAGKIAPNTAVVLHADWSRTASIAFERWFTRKVWPDVRRITGHTRLVTTRPPRTADPAKALGQAGVVVACTTEAGLAAQNALMQAMTAQRPTVASPQTAQAVGARDLHDVLVAHNQRDWIDCCVNALSGSQSQRALSQDTAAFVRDRVAPSPTGISLLDILKSAPARNTPLARAA